MFVYTHGFHAIDLKFQFNTHLPSQAKFARKVSMVKVAKFAIVMIVCVCV